MHIIWSALPNLQHNRLLRLSAATPVRVSRDGEPRTPSDHGASPGLCRSQSRRTGDCAPCAVLGWEGRTMSTAQGAERTTRSATLPLNIYDRSPSKRFPTPPGSLWASAGARPRSAAAARPRFVTRASAVCVWAMPRRSTSPHTGEGHGGGGPARAPGRPARGPPGTPARRLPRNRSGQGYWRVPWVFLFSPTIPGAIPGRGPAVGMRTQIARIAPGARGDVQNFWCHIGS